jgi:acetyl-CoA/propionyl-CoA carboxylase biotin carboxyl carrier protein
MSETSEIREFKRVLIANRGEIALRIVRACRDAGLESVAVYADPDIDAPYVRAADQAVALSGSSAAETYLDMAKLLTAARQTDADAIHPGYGFLAESAAFAQAVLDAGLVWIGPPPEVISALGDKVRAREIAARAGAPLVAGTDGPVAGADEAAAFARQHGLPIAIKASHGGGGRGMRIARTLDEVADLFDAAVREAASAFGRGECFVESYVEGGRHVEAQVLADVYGTVQVVGTRDCTLQRRYQKLVEEAPAPFLTGEQEATLVRSAEAICRAAGYLNAATVEFLLTPQGSLSFLEVNTRLQVEHSVTEESTDVDIVRAQLRIAAGHPLPIGVITSSHGINAGVARRHAIEFRINAEDPARGFAPSTGTITRLRTPSGPGVRLDSGIETGSVIGGQFDSLLAKLIVTGRDRTQAIERARRALGEFEITGVATTLPFLQAVLTEPAYTGDGPNGFAVHTRWIEQEYLPTVTAAGAANEVSVEEPNDGRMPIRIGNRWLSVALPGMMQAREGPLALAREQARARLEPAARARDDLVNAPMQGTVVGIAVADGDDVETGQLIAVVEAMKMENPLRAPHAGRIDRLCVRVGDTVAQGAVLCRVIARGTPMRTSPDAADYAAGNADNAAEAKDDAPELSRRSASPEEPAEVADEVRRGDDVGFDLAAGTRR